MMSDTSGWLSRQSFKTNCRVCATHLTCPVIVSESLMPRTMFAALSLTDVSFVLARLIAGILRMQVSNRFAKFLDVWSSLKCCRAMTNLEARVDS